MKSVFVSILLLIVMQSYSQLCSSTIFRRGFYVAGSARPQFLDTVAGNNFLLGGTQNNNLHIIKTDNNGNPIWSKVYTSAGGLALDGFGKVLVEPGGDFFGFMGANVIVNISGDGVPLVAKRFSAIPVSLYISKICILPNGNRVIVGNHNSSTFLICVSPDLSSIIWQRRLSQELYISNLQVIGSQIFVLGSGSVNGVLLQFSSTGNIVNSKEIDAQGIRSYFTSIYAVNDGYLITGTSGSDGKSFYMRSSVNFDIQKIYQFNIYNNLSLQLAVEQEGDFYGIGIDGLVAALFYISKQDEVLWNTRTNGSSLAGIPRIMNTTKGLVFNPAQNYSNVNEGRIDLCRVDGNGFIPNCNTYASTLYISPIVFNLINSSIVVNPNNNYLLALQPEQVTQEVRILQAAYTCVAPSTCSSLEIEGPPSSCSGDTLLYTARRNEGCHLPLQWKILGGGVYSQRRSDSTIAIKFNQSGTYKVIGSVDTDCSVTADTLTVQITINGQQPPLNIGPADTVICKDNTILLNAKKGFASYSWQDGSSDSTFLVNQPGIYHVAVTDACGLIQRDTITVHDFILPYFSAGEDRSKCNADTIHLYATSGFSNYRWLPTSNINLPNSSNVIVFPATTTSYSVSAEVIPGCYIYDTVLVEVKNSPAVSLGIDKGICEGDSAILNAGIGFTSYLWNTGATSQLLITKATGTYTLAASYVNGCVSRDTIVIKMLSTPVVNLSKLDVLCEGESRVLNAGSFNDYLWSDGSKNQTLIINKLGKYAVVVTDLNGCQGRDSIEIKTILKSPSDFLPADTSLCTYSSYKIATAGTFSRYLWNDGSANSDLIISKPGKYWLDVITREGCKGRDSINIVGKQCLTGLHVPTAFTPNGDSRNDIFRALIYGNIKKFQITIFDRYGSIVYQSTEPAKGWDGRHNGQPRDAGAYTWLCKYQLEGEPDRSEFGTILLIR